MIKEFEYKENDIAIDVQFSGENYLNATEVYQAFGKDRKSFSKFIKRTLTNYTKTLIEKGYVVKSSDGNIVPINEISMSKKSRHANSSVQTQDMIKVSADKTGLKSTWLHPSLAVRFARWLSIDFELWCDFKIKELIESGYTDVHDDVTKSVLPNFNISSLKPLRQVTNGKNKHYKDALYSYVVKTLNEGLSSTTIINNISKTTNSSNRITILKLLNSFLSNLSKDVSIQNFTEFTKELNTRISMIMIRRKGALEKELDSLRKMYKDASEEVSSLKETIDIKTKKLNRISKVVSIDPFEQEFKDDYDAWFNDMVNEINKNTLTKLQCFDIVKPKKASAKPTAPDLSAVGITGTISYGLYKSKISNSYNIRVTNNYGKYNVHIPSVTIGPDIMIDGLFKGAFVMDNKITFRFYFHESSNRLLVFTHAV
jgi:hypothetical protein